MVVGCASYAVSQVDLTRNPEGPRANFWKHGYRHLQRLPITAAHSTFLVSGRHMRLSDGSSCADSHRVGDIDVVLGRIR